MQDNDLCLNIGCWLDVAEGWENIDASPYVRLSKIPLIGNSLLSVMGAPQFPPGIKYGDLIKGLKLPPNSCQLIFASHVLEHFTLPDFHTALKNLYWYLQPGGTLRVIVPDLEKYVKSYLAQRSDLASAAQAAHNFMKISFLGETASRSTMFLRLKEVFSNSRHQWMWDEPSLSKALEERGFKDIRRCNYGDWADDRFGAVENYKRHWDAVCLEATK